MCISSLAERISTEYSAGKSCWALGSLLGWRTRFRGAGGDLSRASHPALPLILSPESLSPGWASGCSSPTGCIIRVFKGFGPKSSLAQLKCLRLFRSRAALAWRALRVEWLHQGAAERGRSSEWRRSREQGADFPPTSELEQSPSSLFLSLPSWAGTGDVAFRSSSEEASGQGSLGGCQAAQPPLGLEELLLAVLRGCPRAHFFNPLEDLVLVALLCPAPIPGWSRALVWLEATERPVAAPAPALPLL